MDAASHNGVDDVREIILQAKTKSIESDYKVFIIDEVHALSNSAWQAMLKLIEEPPATAIFIFCTTDPQKIPNTILSRVQRYDFKKISYNGIVSRLEVILRDIPETVKYDHDALEYIAKVSGGGMRDAITLMDKCLSFSSELSINNVQLVLGEVSYDTMMKLTDTFYERTPVRFFEIFADIFNSGKDIKIFIDRYKDFIVDICKYYLLKRSGHINSDLLSLPMTEEVKDWLGDLGDYEDGVNQSLLSTLINLGVDIKWMSSPRSFVEATLYLFLMSL